MATLIDTRIQGDFNSLVYASDPQSFATAKEAMLADMQAAMLETTDADTKDGLLALVDVISGWAFAGPAEPSEPSAPTSETVAKLRAAKDFVVPDLLEILALLREIGQEMRKDSQAQSLLSQGQAFKLAVDIYTMAKTANTQTYQKEMTAAAGEIASGAVGVAGSAAGLRYAAKAAMAHKSADKARENVRTLENEVNTLDTSLAGAKADRDKAKRVLVEAGDEVKLRVENTKVERNDIDRQLKKVDDELDQLTKKRAENKASKKSQHEIDQVDGELHAKIKTAETKRQDLQTRRSDIDAHVDKAEQNRAAASRKVDDLEDEIDQRRQDLDGKKSELDLARDDQTKLTSEADKELRLSQAVTQLGNGLSSLVRGGFNAGAATFGLDASNSNALVQYLQSMFELANRNAQTSGEFASDSKHFMDEVVGTFKQILDSQGDLGKHLAVNVA